MSRRKILFALLPAVLPALLLLALAAAVPQAAAGQGLSPALNRHPAQADPAVTATATAGDAVPVITSPLSVTAPLLPGVTLTDAAILATPLTATVTPTATGPVTSAVAIPSTLPAGRFRLTGTGDELTIDPLLITVQGGGQVAADSVLPGCLGYVPLSPTVTLDFTGTAPLLRTFFFSDGDTTLGVRAPDGTYRCGDDVNELILDAAVDIADPLPGQYEVWVGSKVATDRIPGFLVFTTRNEVEAGSFSLAQLVRRPAGPATVPVRERFAAAAERLQSAVAAVQAAEPAVAGGPPLTRTFTAEGNLPAVELSTGNTLCGGLVAITPTLAFTWTGASPALAVYAEADADTTLLVRLPDGSLQCADDTDGTANFNPSLTIAGPAEGRYLVWVGRLTADQPATGTLTVTDTPGALPQPPSRP